MSIQTWVSFLATVFFLCGTPGPNMMHSLSVGLRYGFKKSLASASGCLIALLAATGVSCAGVGAVLSASPHLFALLRYAGAAYLMYLGLKSCFAARKPPQSTAEDMQDKAGGWFGLVRDGFLTGVSNPKLLLFSIAFFPQFIDPSRLRGLQLALLTLTFATCEAFWLVVYGSGGRTLARWLLNPTIKRLVDMGVGLVFIGFGVIVLMAH